MIDAETLRQARDIVGVTQQELASRVGVHVRSIANWEKKGSHVPAQKENAVRAFLGKGLEFAEAVGSDSAFYRRREDEPKWNEAFASAQARAELDQLRKAAEDSFDDFFKMLESIPELDGVSLKQRMLRYFATDELLDEIRGRLSEADPYFNESPMEERRRGSVQGQAQLDFGEHGTFDEYDLAADDRQTAPDEDEHQP